MLSLAQSSGSLFCVEWVPSESGPKVIQYKKIKASFDCSTYENFLDSVLSEFNVSSFDASNMLTLSLSLNHVGLTSFKYDTNIPFEDYVKLYEEQILGKHIINNYDIYYHKLEYADDIAMVVYINKKLKKNILDSCKKYDFKVKHIGVDFLSANIAVNQIYKKKKIKSHINWKVDVNNVHYLTYFQDNNLKHFLKVKISKNINVLQYIGSNEFQNIFVEFISKLLFSKKQLDSFVDAVYIYQTKTDYSFIKKILSKSSKIILMDIGSNFLIKNKKNNINYSVLGFNEIGNSLKGIDV